MANYFEELNAVDCSAFTEKKNGLTYLSWADAWTQVCKRHPEATFKVYEDISGLPFFSDGRTCFVKTSVTIATDDGTMKECVDWLPVMDHRNRSIGVDEVTSFDVNKSIKRSLAKAIAMHGLGLHVYRGEDIPDEADEAKRRAVPARRSSLPAVDDATLRKCVEREAQGKRTDDGLTPYQWLRKNYALTAEQERAYFDILSTLKNQINAGQEVK